MASIWKAWSNFWFQPADARPLAAIRILTCSILFLSYATAIPEWSQHYGTHGWFDAMAKREIHSQFGEWRGWTNIFAIGSSLEWNALTYATLSILMVIFALGIVGVNTRWVIPLAWIGHVSAIHQSVLYYSSADLIGSALLFYLAFSPCGAYWSWDSWRQRKGRTESGKFKNNGFTPTYIHNDRARSNAKALSKEITQFAKSDSICDKNMGVADVPWIRDCSRDGVGSRFGGIVSKSIEALTREKESRPLDSRYDSILGCERAPSIPAALLLRCMQIHVCIIVGTSGLAKLSDAAWWSKGGLWNATMLSELWQWKISPQWLFGFQLFNEWIIHAISIGLMVSEIAFPFLVWHRYLCIWLIRGLIVVYFSISLFNGQIAFAALIAASMIAFVSSAELEMIATRLAQWVQSSHSSKLLNEDHTDLPARKCA